jgi:hypothetical protein
MKESMVHPYIPKEATWINEFSLDNMRTRGGHAWSIKGLTMQLYIFEDSANFHIHVKENYSARDA